ncbi:hypothetical protein J4E91_003801 [Alternaria rosae]|nr:hypothetical protein J4E91_003801 [Alternaria rosae]
MKVIEKGSDRRAQVHVYVEGRVAPLEEYGEYIDPRDKAICCYVAIDEGHKPRVGGRFTGTTLAVAYDTIVDGVLRKAHSYVAKAVSVQTNRKIDTEKFLCKTGKDIIDTEITVAPLLDVVTTQDGGPETFGTMEHRLYITRQLGVSHINNVKKYYEIRSDVEGDHSDDTEQKASFKLISPTLKMSLERNTAPLEGTQPSLHKRRADAKRPGSEPWAIFRFHYRSEEDILDRDMVMTFDPDDKDIGEAHILALEPLPSLTIGAKPPSKNDGDASSRSESPMPAGTPSTPAKSTQSAPKISSPIKKKSGPPPNPSEATTMSSPEDQAQTTTPKAPPVASPESTMNPETQEKTQAPSEQPNAEAKQAVANRDTSSSTSTSTLSNNGEKTTQNIAAPPSVPTADMTAKVPSLTESSTKPANAHAEKSVAVAKTTTKKLPPSLFAPAKKPPQTPITPAKKAGAKPALITTNTTNGQKKPDTPPVAVGPEKRPLSTINGTAPEPKRTKPTPTPTPLAPTKPAVPHSPTPKTLSIERQLADQRRKLEDMRKRRMETAKKQTEIDTQMGPYKQRIAEELDRLNQAVMEEESAYTEEAEHYSASVEILQEFKKVDGGN